MRHYGNVLTGRKPRKVLRVDGMMKKRKAERQISSGVPKLPPRSTRPPEPDVATGFGPAASGLP